jgi:hypothetical protein
MVNIGLKTTQTLTSIGAIHMAQITVVDTGIITEDKVYCDNCQIVPITEGDKYCLPCLNDILEYLACEAQQQLAIEKGWY